MDYLKENYFISQDDIKFNLELWKPNTRHNILYVTGLSGSGKSTLGKIISNRYGAEYIEFDMFTLVLVKGIDVWKEKVKAGKYKAHPLVIEYVYQHEFTQHSGSWAKILEKYYFDEHNKFILWLQKRISNDDKLYVLEGAQLFMNLQKDDAILFGGEPLIITGTSMIKSWVRRYHRDVGNDKNIKTYLKYIKKDIPVLFKYYFTNEKKLQEFINILNSDNVMESNVDIIDIKIAIYEKEANGLITESERDELLQYIEEKKTTAEYRLDKFKKRHDYNPKDGTIKMNGKRAKFTTGGSNKKNEPVKGEYSRNMFNYDDVKIHMNTSAFNRKHPKTDEFIFRHEEGHDRIHDSNVGKKHIKREKLRNIYTKIMDDIYNDYKNGKISYDEYFDRTKKAKMKYNKAKDRITTIKDKREEDTSNDDDIRNIIKKNKVRGSHGTSEDEYKADKYAATIVGKKNAKCALNDTEKSIKKDITDDERKEFKARKEYVSKSTK